MARAVGAAYGSELRRRLERGGQARRGGPAERDRPAQRGGPIQHDGPAQHGGPTVVVGADNRPSSPALAAALVEGLTSSGCRAVRLGTVPTPVTYFAEHEFGADGAVQITGSHNPPEYNGIKMTMRKASIHGAAVQDLLRRIREGDFAVGPGLAETRDVLPAYVADVAARFELAAPVKVVVDCGNGTGSVVAVELLEAVGAEVVPLYCESDGTFPNHHPDPTVDENVRDLTAEVRARGADMGIGFDGDADRLGVVDERGRLMRGDILLLVFGLDLLRRRPGATMIFDVKCSQLLPEAFAEKGGVPLMWKTGHSLIKEKMRETGAELAGELSGHICFGDDYLGFDDALYAACRLVELVAARRCRLSDLVRDLPVYPSTPELRIDVAEEEKFALVARAREHFGADREVIAVDGARVLFEDGWGLVRASNTQPAIAARYEARTPEGLARIRALMEDWLRGQGVRIES